MPVTSDLADFSIAIFACLASKPTAFPPCVKIAQYMEQAANLLASALRRMKNSDAASAWLKARWPALAGETIAAHVRPALLRNGVVCLEADSQEWKAQAAMLNEQLRERVNRDWGGALVREVRVELARKTSHVRHEFDNNHLPFLRGCAKPKP